MSFLRERATDALTTEIMRRRHLRRILDIEEQLYPKPWTHRTFVTELSEMRTGSRYYLVAYVGDVLVGYGGMWFSGDDAHITNIAVDPAWQGRGVATEMMIDLSILAHDRGCTAMTLLKYAIQTLLRSRCIGVLVLCRRVFVRSITKTKTMPSLCGLMVLTRANLWNVYGSLKRDDHEQFCCKRINSHSRVGNKL